MGVALLRLKSRHDIDLPRQLLEQHILGANQRRICDRDILDHISRMALPEADYLRADTWRDYGKEQANPAYRVKNAVFSY
ncbi:hypothetical protein [Tateyamaria omphalii]|uniref:hypothetical protein n=1 Tax=Tateyamaria omphalii TaxID=299262 RepID=UPI0012FBFBF1|nr:hypothetical protein [Tateyamaria omphalii]